MDRETAVPAVDSFPGERARRWVDFHRERAAPSTYVCDFVWDVTADAEGPFCTDVDGNVFLDFASHVASSPLGYNNPDLLERLEAFDLVDPMKIAGQDFYVSVDFPPEDSELPGPTELMDRLLDATSHYGMDTVFLSNSGAEAVENAIKICYDHRGGRHGVTFQGAFHGRTLGALSLNRSKSVHRRKFPSIPGIHDVPFCTNRSCTAATCSCGFFPDDTGVSQLRRRLHPTNGDIDPDEVSYVVLEPVQGEGGYHIPSEAFMDEVASLCAEHGIPLIADEIQTGLGRSGEMWASDHYAIEPDVIAAAKGLRVGATISRREVFPTERARLSSTWGAGDVLGSLQGSLTLDVIREQNLTANATERGRQFAERMADVDSEYVVDSRHLGLLLAVEFDSRERREAVMECCLQRGMLTLGCGVKTLRLLPPLDVTARELDVGIDVLLDALDDPKVRREDTWETTSDEAI